MNVAQAYNLWATQYDTNHNLTRDVEARALRSLLPAASSLGLCLEIGCGTGKNTAYLHTIAESVVAVDFSEMMLARAKEKISSPKVQFVQADITQDWAFATHTFDTVVFSLVLEHIADLSLIFSQLARVVASSGIVYIGEFHPFRQYQGKKARFEDADGTHELECYVHHLSEFTQNALQHGFALRNVQEFFDGDDTQGLPRVLGLLLQQEA